MAKKKNKQVCLFLAAVLLLQLSFQVIRPWCWYCEREFEDEKGELTVYT
jgi:hypothetical protein